MQKCIIAAVADNGAIGKNNDLLWHISEDLKYFKKTTFGCPVIMGRKTYESIGRPLPGRLNIVVSRSGFSSPGTVSVSSLQEAFEKALEYRDHNGIAPERCFVIGGAQIYSQSMQYVDKLYLTHVHTSVVDADAWFPEISFIRWHKETASEIFTDDKSGLSFEFATYQRQPVSGIGESEEL